jgi:hypothetical protein
MEAFFRIITKNKRGKIVGAVKKEVKTKNAKPDGRKKKNT